ncbi:HupE/UreJ family protein [Roseateles koreensis]|uniref:HupE/UreJ family protein n=1 Tax=Roseateles koreensis TaxID=2987526 RepID=A0ABT5KTI8_9BURK|nr:HupE/UreJ family protein [Roseateles koreensis]MDC8786257.1 HupE/UreJ family protein [Roseateles koreensis]
MSRLTMIARLIAAAAGLLKHQLGSACLLALTLLLAANPAHAHEMSMVEMQLREVAHGEFLWQWTASEKAAPADVLTPVWPEECQVEVNVLHCGAKGLQGQLRIEGVGKAYSAVLVKVFWLDEQSRVYTLTAGQPNVHLYGSAQDQRGMGEIASAYTLLGVEHILTGVDHLLFVISLLLLVGFGRQLLWTITAFTAAHSLTLASSALGWLVLRSPPVEATIALSIVLVAGEALHQRQTLARRWPALVAFIFGLVHGLGFAGALKEIGLPEQHLLVALLTFNVGVEIGQLLTVGAAWLLWRLSTRWPQSEQTRKARTVLLYLIGTLAAYWSWLRVVTIFS